MTCQDCGNVKWRKTRNGFMLTCKQTKKEIFLRPEDLELDRGLLESYAVANLLSIVKKKFKCTL